jgi:hypothetical protein
VGCPEHPLFRTRCCGQFWQRKPLSISCNPSSGYRTSS